MDTANTLVSSVMYLLREGDRLAVRLGDQLHQHGVGVAGLQLGGGARACQPFVLQVQVRASLGHLCLKWKIGYCVVSRLKWEYWILIKLCLRLKWEIGYCVVSCLKWEYWILIKLCLRLKWEIKIIMCCNNNYGFDRQLHFLAVQHLPT